MRFATLAIHAGAAPDPATGARTQPIHPSNGYVFDDLDHGSDLFALEKVGYAYGRSANPTVAAFERRIAALEGGKSAIACASGQSALLAILTALCRSGDEVIAARHVFGGTVGLLNRFNLQFGLGVRWADAHDPQGLAALVTPRTRAILVEAVINPTGDVVDLAALAAVARAARVPLVVDATLATAGAAQADRARGGHRLALGLEIHVRQRHRHWRDHRGQRQLRLDRRALPDDRRALRRLRRHRGPEEISGLALRGRLPADRHARARALPFADDGLPAADGCETLSLRMRRHSENALALHRFLQDNPAVEAVSHPGLPDHPRYALAAALMPAGMGAIQTVTLKGGLAAARRTTSRLRLFSHLVNVGEARSLVAHPATTTHRNVDPATRAHLGIADGTLRLSVGLEEVEDLIADWEQALAG